MSNILSPITKIFDFKNQSSQKEVIHFILFIILSLLILLLIYSYVENQLEINENITKKEFYQKDKMDKDYLIIIENIGYLLSVLVMISFLSLSVRRFRYINKKPFYGVLLWLIFAFLLYQTLLPYITKLIIVLIYIFILYFLPQRNKENKNF